MTYYLHTMIVFSTLLKQTEVKNKDQKNPKEKLSSEVWPSKDAFMKVALNTGWNSVFPSELGCATSIPELAT